MRLVIVNGMPGVGKTTLAPKLAADLQLPLIGKDMIKELLLDQMGSGTFEDSRFLGKISVKMLYTLVAEYIANDRSLMIENAFYAEFARQELAAIIGNKDVEIIEIYCETSEAERHRRISSRLADGSRHPGHQDNLVILEVDAATYAPLNIGKLYKYDTTSDHPDVYKDLLGQLTD